MINYKKSIGIFFERTIGDLIYTSSIVASIRKNEPNAFIHVVTSNLGLDILQSNKPDYDKISTKFENLINYDTIYYPLRCAQNVPYWFIYGLHIRDLAASSIKIKLSSTYSNIYQPENKISDFGSDLVESRYIIVSNRASADRRKEVPIEMFNKAMKEISSYLPVYQVGLMQDPPIPNCDISFLGNTNIKDSLLLIKNAFMVISIDNYLLHAASAYNTPWIGIYGQYDYLQVQPIDIYKNKFYKIVNEGKFREYNIEGCSKVTTEKILEKFYELKGNLNEKSLC